MAELLKEQKIITYQDARDYLDSLQFHKIKLGLQPMRDFLELLGNPEDRMKIVHVAGTNGKGSVCSALLHVLEKGGYKVGLYTSPHLTSPRERFRINPDYIPKDDFTRLTGKICEILNGRPITYFEFTTSLALLWFYEQKVDLVILETGLGGRLDATNVVKQPILTVITSISMDHEAYLGSTLEQVASEKAGVIKAAVPVITASNNIEVKTVIVDKAKSLGAIVYQYGTDFTGESLDGLEWRYSSSIHDKRVVMDYQNSKPGKVAIENNSIVRMSLDLLQDSGFNVSEEIIAESFAELNWPGRLELINGDKDKPYRYLLDGAHNPAGINSLIEALSYYEFKNLICIWGAMHDKDIASGINSLSGVCDKIILTEVASERSAKAQDMYNLLPNDLHGKCSVASSVIDALEMAQSIFEDGDLILVAGSLYLIGELRPLLVGGLV